MNPLESLKQLNESFQGLYRGSVEDVLDPDKLGRIKVKVYPVFKDMDSQYLPWAIPAMSPFQGGDYQNGFFTIPNLNSHVFIMFENGDPYQPVYFASAHAQQKSISKKDWNLRAQGLVDTINTQKNSNRKQGISLESGGTWDEPSDELGNYPDTHILHTKSGHLIEISDTNGKTRIHIFHKSGSYIDMRDNGDIYKRSNNDCLEIIQGENKISVSGNRDITIEGSASIKATGKVVIKSDAEVSIDGGSGSTKGIVQGDSICAFTGRPHMHISNDIKGSLG